MWRGCSGGAGVLLKLSRCLLRMSVSCKFSTSNGKFPAGFKLKKAKEYLCLLNSTGKWKKRLLCLWILALLILLSCWFPLRSYNVNSGTKQKTSYLFDEETRTFLRHFNVSKNQLQALASLLSESDRVSSFTVQFFDLLIWQTISARISYQHCSSFLIYFQLWSCDNVKDLGIVEFIV